MPFQVQPKLLQTVILNIVRGGTGDIGEIYTVHLTVNGEELEYDVEISLEVPSFSGGLAVFSPLKMPDRYVAEYVFRFASGETLRFPIDMGDLGSAARMRMDKSVPWAWDTSGRKGD